MKPADAPFGLHLDGGASLRLLLPEPGLCDLCFKDRDLVICFLWLLLAGRSFGTNSSIGSFRFAKESWLCKLAVRIGCFKAEFQLSFENADATVG